MTQSIIAEYVRYEGHANAYIDAYLACPLCAMPVSSVIVLHHSPGLDEWTEEVVRRLATYGYLTICPDLFSRESQGGSRTETAQSVRTSGGITDKQALGDIAAAVKWARMQTCSNGGVGIIGFCSGGRLAFLTGCTQDVDAIVDCYGGGVVAGPEKLTPARPVAPIDLAADLGCPLLGLFGREDHLISIEDVVTIDRVLSERGKNHELHTFDDAGHAFFCATAPSYRVSAANDGWNQVRSFFSEFLSASSKEIL